MILMLIISDDYEMILMLIITMLLIFKICKIKRNSFKPLAKTRASFSLRTVFLARSLIKIVTVQTSLES